MRFARTLPILILAVLAACVPESVHGLPEETRITADERFVGTWRARALGTEYRAEVTRRDPATLEVRLTETYPVPGRADVTREARYRLRFHEVGGRRVVAARGPGLDPETGPVHRFATYRFGGPDSVALFFMSEDAVAPYIHPGRLPGRVRTPDPTFRDILLTGTPERIAAFIRTQPAGRVFAVTLGPFARQ